MVKSMPTSAKTSSLARARTRTASTAHGNLYTRPFSTNREDVISSVGCKTCERFPHPAFEHLPPLIRKRGRYKWLNPEKPFCQAEDRADGTVAIAFQNRSISFDQQRIQLGREGVHRLTRCQADPSKEISSSLRGTRLSPDESCSPRERGSKEPLVSLVATRNPSVPKGRGQQFIEPRGQIFNRYFLLANET